MQELTIQDAEMISGGKNRIMEFIDLIGAAMTVREVAGFYEQYYDPTAYTQDRGAGAWG